MTSFMREALAEGERALDRGEVPVGCVFVKDNCVVGRGSNRTNELMNATKHAELVAIEAILEEHGPQVLKDCDLYYY
ncbi:tRNA-specific adenosine deaminase [Thraustotheca clavata]|uniref:tRNA-specific adenosine deaminase n=1 Tax=Thraustotheca clavata TaxID=74557 RepID=A0A1W0A6S2_9STRA|nr:tRNA-specific adenosine deaminase [Thraustotheca clavata]